MEPWQYALVAAAGIAALSLVVYSAVLKHRRNRQMDSLRKLETVLLPKEKVKVICPNRGGRWILTSKRLLRETKGGFAAIRLTDIQSLQGINKAGNRTTSAKNMTRLVIRAEKEYTVYNTCDAFSELAGQLRNQMKKKTSGTSKKK